MADASGTMPSGPVFDGLARVEVLDGVGRADLDRVLKDARRPFVIRGLVADWPLVQAGLISGRAARDYLLRRRRDTRFVVSVTEPQSGGRMFYDSAMTMNFRTMKAKLPEIFARIDATEGQAGAPAIYLASIDVNEFFSGLHEDN